MAGCCPGDASSNLVYSIDCPEYLLVSQCLLTLLFVQCAFMVEPGYDDIGLYVTPYIALDTLWYQLISHFSTHHLISRLQQHTFITTQNIHSLS